MAPAAARGSRQAHIVGSNLTMLPLIPPEPVAYRLSADPCPIKPVEAASPTRSLSQRAVAGRRLPTLATATWSPSTIAAPSHPVRLRTFEGDTKPARACANLRTLAATSPSPNCALPPPLCNRQARFDTCVYAIAARCYSVPFAPGFGQYERSHLSQPCSSVVAAHPQTDHNRAESA